MTLGQIRAVLCLLDTEHLVCVCMIACSVEYCGCATGGASICHIVCTGDESYHVTIYESVQMYACKACYHGV